MIRWMANLIRLQEKRAFRAESIILFACFVGGMRLMLEILLTGYSVSDLPRNVLLQVSWYWMTFFLFGLPVRLLAPPPWEQRINVMLVGLFLGFLPPVIDVLLSGWGVPILGQDNFHYAYIPNFPEGWPWLMIDQSMRMPAGEGGVLWGALFFVGLYMWLRTKSPLRTLAAIVLMYLICMFAGAIMPTLVLRLGRGPLHTTVTLIIYAQIACALLLYLFVYRLALARHVARRFLHALPLLAMASVGYAWVRPLTIQLLGPLLVITLLGIWTIVQNDHWDEQEEAPDREPVVRPHDVIFLNFSVLLTFFGLLLDHSAMALPVLLYATASYLYNAPLYRGKRYFPANLKLEGIWGGTAFLIGVFAAAIPLLQEHAYQPGSRSGELRMMMTPFSWYFSAALPIAALLAFGGWSVLAVLKDEKDVETDARLGTQTLFTLLGRRGVSAERVALYARIAALLCMLIAAWGPVAAGMLPAPYGGLMTLLIPVALLRFRQPPRPAFQRTLLVLSLFLFLLADGLTAQHRAADVQVADRTDNEAQVTLQGQGN